MINYAEAQRKYLERYLLDSRLEISNNRAKRTIRPFPTDDSLRKMSYLASNNIVKKWTQRYREWDMVLNHLALLFEGRQAVYARENMISQTASGMRGIAAHA